MTDREFVESVWESAGPPKNSFYKEAVYINLRGGHRGFDSWSAAAAFTRDRLEEIRQLREEIELVEGCDYTGMLDTPRRLISRLKTILAYKLKGMKEVA